MVFRIHTPLKHQTLPIVIICIVACLCYANTFHAPFYFDDYRSITENTHIRMSRLSWDSLGDILQSPSKNRPFANFTFALNYYFGEYQLPGYHAVNLFVHLSTGIFLFLFIQMTLHLSPDKNAAPTIPGKYPVTVPLFASLLWLANPGNIQAVTYIVQRMTSLAALFYLLGFCCYIKARLIQRSSGPNPIKIFGYFFICAISAMLGLASKEIIATLPVMIFIYEWFFFQNLNPQWFIRRIPWILGMMLLIFVLGMIFFQGNPFDKIFSLYAAPKSVQHFTIVQRLLTELRVVIYYLSLFIFPHPKRLHLDYTYPISDSLADPATTLMACFCILGLIIMAIQSAGSSRVTSFCILWFFCTLAIESSFIGLALIYEHRMYLPSMMVSLLVILYINRFAHSKRLFIPIGIFMILLFTCWTFQRNILWQDRFAFWNDNMLKSPSNPRPAYAMGKIQQDSGQVAEAIDYFKTAVRLKPNYREVHMALGSALTGIGRLEEAKSHYRIALLLSPNDPELHNQLGDIAIRENDFITAIRYFNKALDIHPNHPVTLNNLGNAYFYKGDPNQAARYYQAAIDHDPNYPDAYYNLGMLFSGKQNREQAIRYYQQTIQLAPDHAKAHKSLADLLFLNNEIPGAITHYKKAFSVDPKDAQLCYNLGVAYTHRNDLTNAILFFKKAIEIDPDYPNAKLALERLESK